MKKFVLLILIATSLHATAQLAVLGDNNRLDEMVRNSIDSYIKHVDNFFMERGRKKPSVYYVNRLGLTRSFLNNDSIRSIPRVKYFSLDNTFSPQFTKTLKEGFRGLFIETILNKKRITIAVSDCGLSMKGRKLYIAMSDWGIYTYEYSEEKEDWVLIDTEIGGI